MKWIKWGKYAIRTEKHSISKVMVNNNLIYVLWEINIKNEIVKSQKLIGYFKSSQEAKNAIGN